MHNIGLFGSGYLPALDNGYEDASGLRFTPGKLFDRQPAGEPIGAGAASERLFYSIIERAWIVDADPMDSALRLAEQRRHRPSGGSVERNRRYGLLLLLHLDAHSERAL